MIRVAAEMVSELGVVVASCPPEPRPLLVGEWVTVPGVARGTTRRFAVCRKASDPAQLPKDKASCRFRRRDRINGKFD